MKPTVEYIECKFRDFNQTYFGGSLKELPIGLSDAKTFQGMVVYRKEKLPNGKWHYSDFRMLINTRVDVDETELEDTILHEMIHYYIHSNQIEDTSAHGVLFRRMMNHFNEKYGRHITISKKTTREERKQLRGTKPTRHIFAIIEMHDGRRYIKVVPRIVQRICTMHKMLQSDRNIKSVDWYYAESAYLNDFPSSMSNRMYRFDEQELSTILSQPTTCRLLCDGESIKEARVV